MHECGLFLFLLINVLYDFALMDLLLLLVGDVK